MTGEWPIKVVRLEEQTRSIGKSAWLLSPAVFLLTAGATFALFYLRTESAEATTARTGPLLDPRAASIQLRVDTERSGLLLSWNRESPAVLSASDGILHIDDGSDHRDLALDRNQIQNGSVFYRPASQDISFRLDLRDGRGADVAQILRVLDAQPRLGWSDAAALHGGSSEAAAPRVPVETAVERRNAVIPGTRATSPEHRPAPSPVQRDSGHAPARENPAEASHRVEPQKAGSAALSANSLPPVISNATAPAPETPIVSQPFSAANPEPAAREPEPSRPAAAPGAQPAANVPASDGPKTVAAPVAAFVPPRPLKWVKLNEQSLGVARVAQGLDVKVKIKIDESGNVTSAHALIEGPKRDKKLMAAAAAAVRGWKFEPAKAHGANVSSEETIVLHFGPESQ